MAIRESINGLIERGKVTFNSFKESCKTKVGFTINSTSQLTRNPKNRLRFKYSLAITIYLALLLIFHTEIAKFLQLVWVDTIATRFSSDSVIAQLIFWVLFAFVCIYYVSVLSNERKTFNPRFIILLLFFSLFLTYCFNQGEYIFNGLYTWIYWIVALTAEVINGLKYKCLKNPQIEPSLLIEKPQKRNTNDIEKRNDAYGRSEFAIQTANLLKTTFDKDVAFAVGITGTWGSGKTSLTNDLKNLLEKEVDFIFEFRPWFCKCSSEIIDDFFKEYRSHIEIFLPSLSPKIKTYQDALQNIIVHNNYFNATLKTISHTKSTESIYQEIIQILKKAQIKTVIIIDDLDRLDKNEILEIFRLIRNVGNFPFIQFIVSYDKKYVLNTLNENSKISYADYMMKIFNVEIALPTFEEDIICNELSYQLKRVLDSFNIKYTEEDIRQSIDLKYKGNKLGENDLLIPIILPTIRDIYRFINSLKIQINAYPNQIFQDEIYLPDVIHLELLRYKFPELYDVLRDNPLLLLFIDGDSYSLVYEDWVPSLNVEGEVDYSDIDNLRNKMYLNLDFQGDENIKNAEALLAAIFSYDSDHYNSIRYIDNYFRYFASRLSNKNIYFSQFIALLNKDKKEIEEQITGWYSDNDKNKKQIEAKLKQCFDATLNFDTYAINHRIVYRFINTLSSSEKIQLSKEIQNAYRDHIYTLSNNKEKLLSLKPDHFRNIFKVFLINPHLLPMKPFQNDAEFILSNFLGLGSHRDVIYEIIKEEAQIQSFSRLILGLDAKRVDDKIRGELITIVEEKFRNTLNDESVVNKTVVNNFAAILELQKSTDREEPYLRYDFIQKIIQNPVDFVNENVIYNTGSISFNGIERIELNDDEKLNILRSFERIDRNKSSVKAQNLWVLFMESKFKPLLLVPDKQIPENYDFMADVERMNNSYKLTNELNGLIDKVNTMAEITKPEREKINSINLDTEYILQSESAENAINLLDYFNRIS